MTNTLSGDNCFAVRFVCVVLPCHQRTFIALIQSPRDAFWISENQSGMRFADLNYIEQLAERLTNCYRLLNVTSIGFGASSQPLRPVALWQYVLLCLCEILRSLSISTLDPKLLASQRMRPLLRALWKLRPFELR